MVLHGDQWVRKTNTKQTQICVSVTDKEEDLSEEQHCAHSCLFGTDEMSLLANGKENSVLVADTELYQKMMRSAMYMQDRCETIDPSQNSLEDQLVGIRGAVSDGCWFQIGCSSRSHTKSKNYSLSIQVGRSRKPRYIARNFLKCSPSFSDCTSWLSGCLVPCFRIGFGCEP